MPGRQKKILCVFGTRPEIIKFAPVIGSLRARNCLQVVLCATGQHREMQEQALAIFRLKPDYDLHVMTSNQSLSALTIRLLQKIEPILQHEKPDLIFVQGDTTTAMAAAVAAFYNKISIIHLEAGLRSHDMMSPWPEEVNRKIVSRLSSLHLAPTQKAKKNLIDEGVSPDRIHVTGNTVIDALWDIKKRIDNNLDCLDKLQKKYSFLKKRFILLTGHRRESHGFKHQKIFDAVKELAMVFDVQVIYPVHLNPNVKNPAKEALGSVENIFLMEPVDYTELVYLLSRCHFVITDSGGIQEEAPSFGKPVLVTRDVTERTEGIEAGSALLVGTNQEAIFLAAKRLLENAVFYQSMSQVTNPYGDGHASERISDLFEELYQPREAESVNE
jgi:UDP-N-acetylglucosamine 2-epimerase